jgi:hypothetical protein
MGSARVDGAWPEETGSQTCTYKRNLLATVGSRESTHLGWRQLHDFVLAADIEKQSETGVLFDAPFDCLVKSYFSPLTDQAQRRRCWKVLGNISVRRSS